MCLTVIGIEVVQIAVARSISVRVFVLMEHNCELTPESIRDSAKRWQTRNVATAL